MPMHTFKCSKTTDNFAEHLPVEGALEWSLNKKLHHWFLVYSTPLSLHPYHRDLPIFTYEYTETAWRLGTARSTGKAQRTLPGASRGLPLGEEKQKSEVRGG